MSGIDTSQAVTLRITERLDIATRAMLWLEDQESLPLALITYKWAIKDAIGMAFANSIVEEHLDRLSSAPETADATETLTPSSAGPKDSA